jgi:hypothetical protein
MSKFHNTKKKNGRRCGKQILIWLENFLKN